MIVTSRLSNKRNPFLPFLPTFNPTTSISAFITLINLEGGGHVVVGVVSVCGSGRGLAGVVFFGSVVAKEIVGVIFSGVVRSGSRRSGGLGRRRCK